jgi:hypothetical protein
VSALSALRVEVFLDMVMLERGLMLNGVLLRVVVVSCCWARGGRRMLSREEKMVSRKEKG